MNNIQNVQFKRQYESLHVQNKETDGNIEFLQPYPAATADALLGIGTAVISADLSLSEHLLHASTSYIPMLLAYQFCKGISLPSK
jgi:hypothetical protein